MKWSKILHNVEVDYYASYCCWDEPVRQCLHGALAELSETRDIDVTVRYENTDDAHGERNHEHGRQLSQTDHTNTHSFHL